MRQTNFNSLHSQVNHSSQSHRRLNAVSQSHRRGKDSSVLISNLESEIMTLSQKNDQAKTLNRQLMVRLNEERANFKDSSRRLGFLRSGLLKDESEYKDKLGIVDRNCKKGNCDNA